MYSLSEKKKRIKVDVSYASQRTSQGKLFTPSGPPWAEEVGFLTIDPNDYTLFDGKVANVNCHVLRNELITSREMRDPLAFSRLDSIRTLIDINPPLVFKMGMSTDLTMGRLVEIGLVQTDNRNLRLPRSPHFKGNWVISPSAPLQRSHITNTRLQRVCGEPGCNNPKHKQRIQSTMMDVRHNSAADLMVYFKFC